MIVKIGGIPVYNAIITDDETGMFKISLVDDPAVMSNFQAFDRARKPLMYAVSDEEKRLVRGVVMRADFPIYRYDDQLGEYYVIYRAEEIRKMAEKYLVEGRQNDVNTMHLDNSDVEGVQMVQYFIKGAGVSVDGFPDIADGSLFAEFHIVNDDVWAEIRKGTYKGFSLEGVFDLVPEQDRDDVQEIVDMLDGAFKKIAKNKMSKLSKIRTALAKALMQLGNMTTDKGVIAWDGDEDIKVGDAVYIEDEDGNRTPAADDTYKADDVTIVVVDGAVAELIDPEAPVVEPAEPAQEMSEVTTDGGVLTYDGELAVGTEVFVVAEDGTEAPAADGQYLAEDGRTIVVADGVVTEIIEPSKGEEAPSEEVTELRAENARLAAQVAELKAQIAKMSKMSAAKPAHEELKSSAKFAKTGNRSIDRLAELMSK